MPARQRETKKAKHARLVGEIIAHPETLGYHPTSDHQATHVDSFKHFTIKELEEILENAHKRSAPAS